MAEEGDRGKTTTMKSSASDKDLAGDTSECSLCKAEEQELKTELDDLKVKFEFIKISYPPLNENTTSCFSDLFLLASNDRDAVPLPVHKVVLAKHSPVFQALFQSPMQESSTGTIKIQDVSHNVLGEFAHYLYTAEARLDAQMACHLLFLADKYDVERLKSDCEKFLVTDLSLENAVDYYLFARKHQANNLVHSVLVLMVENMQGLRKWKEYKELMEDDPFAVLDIYKAYYNSMP